MLWIALILPALPLQVYTRGTDDPGALAVVDRHPRQRVVAATAAALACGVEPGLGVAGALAVAPRLELKHRDSALEYDTLVQFATWAGRFTPSVSIESCDAIVLEVSACLRLFGGLAMLADTMRKGAAELGLEVRLAAAPTPLAACWLARARPDALIPPRADWWRCLDPLPVRLLTEGGHVTSVTLDLLRGVGVRTLGEAARLPRDGLARRQGAGVTRALARARGETPDPRPWHRPPECFDARLALPASVTTIEPLLFASRRLVAGLVAWLAGLHAAVDRCCLHLEHEHRPDTVVHIVTGQPSRNEDRFAMLLREHLAVLHLDAAVAALRLTADSPLILSPRSADLFGDPAQARDAATVLLDRLRARLGKAAVRSIRPWPGHRPEHAWRDAEPAVPANPGTPGTAATRTRLPRPIWLLTEPRPLPSMHGLTLVSGPERIESGWWDGADIRRDYYVARTRNAALWWIFQRLDGPGDWYVHGYFG